MRVLFGKGRLGSALSKSIAFARIYEVDDFQNAREDNFKIAYLAVPSSALKDIAPIVNEKKAIAVIFSKGFAGEKLPHELFEKPVVAYGATFAEELGTEPSYIAVGGAEPLRKMVTDSLRQIPNLKVIETPDTVGLEVGAILSKVFSIALGALSSMSGGFNLLGLAFQEAVREMELISRELGGGNAWKLMLGDLYMCTLPGNPSRNFRFGRELAEGVTRVDYLAEGVHSTTVLVEKYGFDHPLLSFTYRLIRREPEPFEMFLEEMYGIDF